MFSCRGGSGLTHHVEKSQEKGSFPSMLMPIFLKLYILEGYICYGLNYFVILNLFDNIMCKDLHYVFCF